MPKEQWKGKATVVGRTAALEWRLGRQAASGLLAWMGRMRVDSIILPCSSAGRESNGGKQPQLLGAEITVQ